MKKLFFLVITLLLSLFIQAQTITGTWKTVDDDTNEAKSHVEIYQSGDKYFGKVTKLLQHEPDRKCEKCPGERYNQPVMGMVIVENLVRNEGYLQGGKILDPEKGKEYSCKLWLQQGNSNVLEVRGFIGFAALGRTQKWQRVQ